MVCDLNIVRILKQTTKIEWGYIMTELGAIKEQNGQQRTAVLTLDL
jgi:hypothetical protein